MAKAKTAAANGQPVSHEEFIRAWQASKTLQEVADKLGGRMRASTTAVRASYLRKRGVALKSMRSRSERLTPDRIAELNALAQRLGCG